MDQVHFRPLNRLNAICSVPAVALLIQILTTLETPTYQNQLPLPQSCVDAFQSHVSLSLYTYVLRGLSTLSITMIHYMDTIFQVPSHKLGISTCRHNSFLVVYQVSPDC